MFTGPVGPVEVFFYWPEAVFGNFYWPGAIGLPLASSPVLAKLATTSIRVNLPWQLGKHFRQCMLHKRKGDAEVMHQNNPGTKQPMGAIS